MVIWKQLLNFAGSLPNNENFHFLPYAICKGIWGYSKPLSQLYFRVFINLLHRFLSALTVMTLQTKSFTKMINISWSFAITSQSGIFQAAVLGPLRQDFTFKENGQAFRVFLGHRQRCARQFTSRRKVSSQLDGPKMNIGFNRNSASLHRYDREETVFRINNLVENEAKWRKFQVKSFVVEHQIAIR